MVVYVAMKILHAAKPSQTSGVTSTCEYVTSQKKTIISKKLRKYTGKNVIPRQLSVIVQEWSLEIVQLPPGFHSTAKDPFFGM